MKRLILSLIIQAVCDGIIAQSISITPGTTNAVCPGTPISYTANNPNGNPPTCRYEWTVSKGRFDQGGNIGRTVRVIWNDEPGTGTLKVVLKNCDALSANFENVSKTNTYTILSVYGKNFGSYTNLVDIPYCYSSPVTVNLSVPKMYVQGTGGIGQPPLKEVDAYLWSIPLGWAVNGTSIQGPTTYSQTTNVIVLTPIAAEDGIVRVQGSLNNTCLGNYGSNFATITLRRTPVVNISAPSGYIGPRCGLKTPVTFTIPSTVPCVTSYSWSFPPGWSGASTSNSITLTPSGTPLDGGYLQVLVGLNTGKTIKKVFELKYLSSAPSNPTIAKNNSYFEMCPGDSWQYTCNPPSGYPSNYGFDWYTQGAALLVNGVSTSASSPLHTTSNTVTISPTPTAYGSAYVKVRLSAEGCTPSNYTTGSTRVGVYNNNEFSIIGPPSICPNTAVDFRSSYIAPDILGYQWTAPSGWSNSGQGTPYFSVSVPYSFSGGAAITLRLRNRCGITNTPYVFPLYSYGCGYSYSVSPNPVSETLTIADFDPKGLFEARLADPTNQKTKTAKLVNDKMEIDVKDLPNGLYVLIIDTVDGTKTYNIIVSHK